MTSITIPTKAGLQAADVRNQALGRGKGAVCFTWDDSWGDWMTEVDPLATELGQRHTFCCITDVLDTPGRLTSAQVTQLWNEGHEIASHSKSHQDMTTLTSAQRVTEFDVSKSVLEGLTAPGEVQTFCYPFGGRNAASDQEAYLRFSRLMRVGSTGSSFYLYGPDRTQVQQIIRFDWQVSSHSRLMSLIRRCATEPWRIVVMGHDPGATVPASSSPAQALEAMQLCHDLDVPTLTIQEAFNSTQLIPNAGFEETAPGTDLGAWEPILTAGGTASVVTDTPSTGLQGTQSLRLRGSSNTDSALARCIVPVKPGIPMTLQGRYRTSITSGAGSITAAYQLLDGLGGTVTSGSGATSALTATSWTQFSLTMTVPMSATQQPALARIDLSLANLTGDAYFDHIHLGPSYEGNVG